MVLKALDPDWIRIRIGIQPKKGSGSVSNEYESETLLFALVPTRVVDPYSFFTDPDPDPELVVGGQYGSGSGSNTDPGL